MSVPNRSVSNEVVEELESLLKLFTESGTENLTDEALDMLLDIFMARRFQLVTDPVRRAAIVYVLVKQICRRGGLPDEYGLHCSNKLEEACSHVPPSEGRGREMNGQLIQSEQPPNMEDPSVYTVHRASHGGGVEPPGGRELSFRSGYVANNMNGHPSQWMPHQFPMSGFGHVMPGGLWTHQSGVPPAYVEIHNYYYPPTIPTAHPFQNQGMMNHPGSAGGLQQPVGGPGRGRMYNPVGAPPAGPYPGNHETRPSFPAGYRGRQFLISTRNTRAYDSNCPESQSEDSNYPESQSEDSSQVQSVGGGYNPLGPNHTSTLIVPDHSSSTSSDGSSRQQSRSRRQEPKEVPTRN